MATIPYPAQMLGPEGEVVTARNSRDYWNYVYRGYRLSGQAVPVNENDAFTDAAVAALIDNMSSQTYAALARRMVTAEKLRIQASPPTSPAPGTVWIKNSTT